MGQYQLDSTHTINSEEIPQLEEDWDDSQFANTNADTNLINRHNTHSESERIITPNIYLIYQTINIIMKKTPLISCSIQPRSRLLQDTDKEIADSTPQPCWLLPITPRSSRHSTLACMWKRKTCSSPWT